MSDNGHPNPEFKHFETFIMELKRPALLFDKDLNVICFNENVNSHFKTDSQKLKENGISYLESVLKIKEPLANKLKTYLQDNKKESLIIETVSGDFLNAQFQAFETEGERIFWLIFEISENEKVHIAEEHPKDIEALKSLVAAMGEIRDMNRDILVFMNNRGQCVAWNETAKRSVSRDCKDEDLHLKTANEFGSQFGYDDRFTLKEHEENLQLIKTKSNKATYDKKIPNNEKVDPDYNFDQYTTKIHVDYTEQGQNYTGLMIFGARIGPGDNISKMFASQFQI